ncbi:MAG: ADP-forming succinate--CoA ligase subunit beta [Candidatus Bathyarchaeia archaeon]
MKLLEYEAKKVFRQYGIPIPQGGLARSPEEAEKVAWEVGCPVVVKAQLPIGGRGRAGGIIFSNSPSEAAGAAERLLAMKLRDIPVSKLLVERKLSIEDEFYIGFTVDRGAKSYIALASSEGGVDIEEVAVKSPEKIIKHLVDPFGGFHPHDARWMARQMGFSGTRLTELADIIMKLYGVAVSVDAELTEINPLALTPDGFKAVDARLNIDNNALYRHQDLVERYREGELAELSPREIEARKLGFSYVEMKGNIGVIGNGAGLTMATIDTVAFYGGNPGNFLDLGGGAPQERIEAAVSFVLSDPRITVLLVNILGGITRCDDTARGIVEARRRVKERKFIVVRLMGTNEEEGRRILGKEDIESLDTMEEAAERAVSLAEGGMSW